jgi:hypothetical protein
MSLSAGTRLGPYQIVSALGAGGIGRSWAIDGTRRARLTFGPTHDSDVIWAPDGQRLAFGHGDGSQLHELTIGHGAGRRLREFGGGRGFSWTNRSSLPCAITTR